MARDSRKGVPGRSCALWAQEVLLYLFGTASGCIRESRVMDKRQYEQAFDKQYNNMKYSEALEVVGAMKYSGVPKSRYLEMLIYYEQGEYESIRNALKGKRIDNVEERELYLSALIELQMYEEFESYYSEYDSISQACLSYIDCLSKMKGHHLPLNHKAIMSYPTYFDRRLRWLVAAVSADIFNLSEERKMVTDAGMTDSDIDDFTRNIEDKFELIPVNDAVNELIKRYVDEGRQVPLENVLYMPLLYNTPKEKLEDVFRHYTELPDIAGCLQLCRRIHMPGALADTVSVYWNEIQTAVRDGNMRMTELLADIYADIGHNKGGGGSFGMEPIEDKVSSALEKDAPYYLMEINDFAVNREIENALSPKALFSYKAAGWKFCTSARRSRGDEESQILCLSYLRLLEIEINERIIFPLCEKVNVRQKYEIFKSRLNDVDREEVSKEWEYRVSCLEKAAGKKNNGLRFPAIITLFDSLRYKRYKKESLNREFAGELRADIGQLLTEEGMTALTDGSMVRMMETEKLELFRNPPAGIRYSGLELALDCRNYVEQQLIKLAGYVK